MSRKQLESGYVWFPWNPIAVLGMRRLRHKYLLGIILFFIAAAIATLGVLLRSRGNCAVLRVRESRLPKDAVPDFTEELFVQNVRKQNLPLDDGQNLTFATEIRPQARVTWNGTMDLQLDCSNWLTFSEDRAWDVLVFRCDTQAVKVEAHRLVRLIALNVRREVTTSSSEHGLADSRAGTLNGVVLMGYYAPGNIRRGARLLQGLVALHRTKDGWKPDSLELEFCGEALSDARTPEYTFLDARGKW